jgi:glycosyltransferase involved in cell wall biosynthesis
MKVAIISFYCFDSSIPLAKNLLLKGVEVDMYCVMKQWNQNGYVFDFTNHNQPNGFVDPKIVKSVLGEKLLKYLSKINTRIFIYPVRRLQKYFLGDLRYAYKLTREIKKNNYDVIHIVPLAGRFPFFLWLLLKNQKIVLTLHEVTFHESKTPFIEILKMKWLVKNSIPIIFQSYTTKNRFISFRENFLKNSEEKDNLTMIRFGLYQTYTCFSNQKASPQFNHKEKANILFLGRIVPYKGIHFLIDAVKILQEHHPIHLVVAGNGEPYFDFKDVKSYDFINRSVSNEEIVRLIEECDMVVLPYTSASQSGIPMTAYVFNKPIVANDVDGLSEVIDHLETGILVDNLDEKSLASGIEKLLLDKELNKRMEQNIKKKYSEGEFSWSSIADQTINFYEKQLQI